MPSNAVTPEQEYRLVYDGICAVAAVCDGAQSKDLQGFDGQDTHFGRRVAMVSFDAWTPAVREECARIARKYAKQIQAYTGVDVTELQVVKDAADIGTVYEARDDARTYERRAKGAAVAAKRRLDVVKGRLALSWDRKDPDFRTLVCIAQGLPGRRYDGETQSNLVDVSDALRAFVLEWDFPVTNAAQVLLDAPAAVLPPAITLKSQDKVIIDLPYNPAQLPEIQNLPGRHFDRERKVNEADTSRAVLAFAARWDVTISDEARQACEGGESRRETAALAEGDLKVLVGVVSRAKDPTALPAAFEDLLRPILARYGAEAALS